MEQQDIEIQLWEYIDGDCDSAAKAHIAHMIATDTAWKACYEQLTALHNALPAHIKPEHPSMRFTKNVMDALAIDHAVPAVKRRYINPVVVWMIAGFFIVSAIGFFIYALNIAEPGTSQSLLTEFSLTHVSAYLVNNNTLHMLIWANVVTGLL